MLAPFLYSTYKRYKEDTNYVANWLAQTAKRCGYSITLPASTLVTSSHPHWQGKGKSIAPPLKRRVPMKVYTSLSRHIAHHQPPVEIPISFLNTVERTIKARQLTSRHYNGTGAAPPDDGHAYFIGVLESVLDILKPLFSAQQLHARMTTHTPTSGITNAFSALEVEEPSERLMPAQAAVPKPCGPAPTVVEFEAEPMKKEDAEAFAALCLMNDIDHIMSYVKHLWRLYADGKIELVAASVAALLAADMVERLEIDYLRETDRFDNASEDYAFQIARRCYASQCNSSGVKDANIPMCIEELKTISSYAGPNFALSTLLAVTKELITLKHHYDPEGTPVYEPGTAGVVDISRDRQEKSSEEKIEDDRIVLTNVLPLMQNAWTAGLDEKAHMPDSLLYRLHDYMSDKDHLTISLAFAAQAYLEAYHIVGNRAALVFAN